MESINGVTFEDYVAASAHLSNGMAEEELLQILGLEKPVWEETLNKWNDRLGVLMSEDASYATKFGDIFANPKVGRFANVEGTPTDTISGKDIFEVVPDYNTYQKIFFQQSVAAKYGLDPVTILEENDVALGGWGKLGMHYGVHHNPLLNNEDVLVGDKYISPIELMQYWEAYWEDYYKEHQAGIADDIEF